MRGCGGDAGDAASEESALAETVGTGGGGSPASSSQRRPGTSFLEVPRREDASDAN